MGRRLAPIATPAPDRLHPSSMRSPLFVVFEGPDGSGTSTQCQILCDRLRAEGHEIVQTREPGGTEAGERDHTLPGMIDDGTT